MARLNRLVIPGLAHHVIHRAVAGSVAFVDATDGLALVKALQRSCAEQGVAVHAYAFVQQELQLLVTPANVDSLSRMMQAMARFYVPAFNRRHARAGALWQGRFRAAPVGGPAALLTCMIYTEQVPMRNGWSGAPGDFEWSSAGHHIGSRTDAWLARVPVESAYWQLGNTPFERDAAYESRLGRALLPEEVLQVESTTLKGWPMGSGEFLAGLKGMTARRLAPDSSGRPKRPQSI